VKIILRSTDLSLIESAQIALEAHDIATVLSDQNATGLPASASALALVDDRDFERAAVVLSELKRTPVAPWWQGAWAPRALLWVVVPLILALCGWYLFGGL